MPSTTNFGWTTPADTDLVKDGASAIRTLGNGIDTSFVDLKGGTTGQVLAKATNTDLDFTWVTSAGDIEGVSAGVGISGGGTSGTVTITNSMATAIDAKGDLVVGTGADTFSRLGVGTNNQVLSADSSTATGLKWATVSSGGFTELATGSLSGQTTTISSISGSYRNLYIRVEDLVTSGNVNVFLRFNSDNATNYRYVSMNSRDGTSTGSGADSGLVVATTVNSTGTDQSFVANIYNYSQSVSYKVVDFTSLVLSPISSASITAYTGGGGWVNTAAINSISIIAGSTATLTGTYYIYGAN